MIAGIMDWDRLTDLEPLMARMQARSAFDLKVPWDQYVLDRCILAQTAADLNHPVPIPRDGRKPPQRFYVVFDGIIYNRLEVHAALGLSANGGLRADAQLVSAAYARWEGDFLRHVVGDFACVIWDATSRSLFAAVDPFGLRGLHYCLKNRCFALASRASPLCALPWVGTRPSDKRAVLFLIDAWGDAGETFYQNVRQLPPGHLLKVNNGLLTLERYWLPGKRNSYQLQSVAEVLEGFEDLSRQAVRQRLMQESPVGILMSGGFDSTAIAGLAADISGREQGRAPDVLLLSGVFGDLPCDESKRINAAVAQLPFAHRSVLELSRGPTVDEMRQDVHRHEAPVLCRQRALYDALGRLSQSFGAGVIMNGIGGDELACDFGYHADLLRSGRFHHFLRAIQLISRSEGISWSRSALLALREACPESWKLPARLLRRLFTPQNQSLPAWLTADAQALVRKLARPMPAPGGFDSKSLEITWEIITDPYTHWANKWWVDEFAKWGMRCCSPLLDRRLFEFLFSIPVGIRPVRDELYRFKPLLSKSLQKYVPREIIEQNEKVIFDSYNCLMFNLGFEGLRRYLFESSTWYAEEFVARAQAETMFAAYQHEASDVCQKPLALASQIEPLRRIAGLELWLRESTLAIV
jgi:asparagine synthase (glutamine-hydrolysing)